jgi:hypothetical protein
MAYAGRRSRRTFARTISTVTSGYPCKFAYSAASEGFSHLTGMCRRGLIHAERTGTIGIPRYHALANEKALLLFVEFLVGQNP